MKILITGNTKRPGQGDNIKWLYHLLNRVLVNSIDAETIPEIYCCTEGAILEDRVPEIAPDIVVSFESPPEDTRLFRRSGCDHINFKFSPIRFMPDLFFETDGIPRHRRYLVDYEYICAVVSAMKARGSVDRALDEPSWVVFGQTPNDLSLLQEGEIRDLGFYKEELSACISQAQNEGVKVLYKPHPYGSSKDNSDLMDELGVPTTTENTYRLLSSPMMRKAIAVSSSVLSEAGFFLVPSKYLSNVSLYSHYRPKTIYGWSVLDPAFWNPKAKSIARNLRGIPNLIRDSRNMYWAYQGGKS